MKISVVSSSDLDKRCWSAKRYVDPPECHECDRVRSCELPEAYAGRLRLALNKYKLAALKAKQAGEDLEKAFNSYIRRTSHGRTKA